MITSLYALTHAFYPKSVLQFFIFFRPNIVNILNRLNTLNELNKVNRLNGLNILDTRNIEHLKTQLFPAKLPVSRIFGIVVDCTFT